MSNPQSENIALTDIERWVISAVEAGHAPTQLLGQMVDGGWQESQALAVIESALRTRLKSTPLPFDRAWVDQLPCFPHVDRQALSPPEIRLLNDFANSDQAAFGTLSEDKDFWAGRTLLPSDIRDPVIVSLLRELRQRMIETTRGLLGDYFSNCPPLYADVVNFARWPPGYELQPHADRENPDGIPHPYPWRDFAVVVYVNADYEGGNIYFPTLELEFKPEPGMWVIFPGSLKYLHGVRPVTRGVRHTIASFLTFDATQDMPF